MRWTATIAVILTIMAFSLMPALGFGPPAAPSRGLLITASGTQAQAP